MFTIQWVYPRVEKAFWYEVGCLGNWGVAMLKALLSAKEDVDVP